MAKGYIFDKLLNRKIEGETNLGTKLYKHSVYMYLDSLSIEIIIEFVSKSNKTLTTITSDEDITSFQSNLVSILSINDANDGVDLLAPFFEVFMDNELIKIKLLGLAPDQTYYLYNKTITTSQLDDFKDTITVL